MKLNLSPPENLTLRLDGETMERLRSIQNARKESRAAWKLEELAAALFAHFLAEAEMEGMTGGPKQPRGKRGSAPETSGAEAHD